MRAVALHRPTSSSPVEANYETLLSCDQSQLGQNLPRCCSTGLSQPGLEHSASNSGISPRWRRRRASAAMSFGQSFGASPPLATIASMAILTKTSRSSSRLRSFSAIPTPVELKPRVNGTILSTIIALFRLDVNSYPHKAM